MGGEGKISAYLKNRRFLIGLTVLLSIILITVVILIIRGRSPFKAEEISPTPPPEGYIYVDPEATGSQTGTSWNSAYATLQQAINRFPNSEEGGGRVILMKQGVYNTTTNINIGSNNWQNNIIIIGGFRGDENNALPRGTDPTVIDFNATQNNLRHFNINSTYNIELRNLTITRGYFGSVGGGGLRIADSNSIKITRCRFINNRTSNSTNGAAVNIINSSNIVIRESEFKNNYTPSLSGGFGGGIFIAGDLQRNSSGEISRNFFYFNTAFGGGAIALRQYTNFRIFNNIFSLNQSGSLPRSGGAIYADGHANNSVINHNTFVENMAVSNGQVVYLGSQDENDTSNKLTFRYNLIKVSSSLSVIERSPLVNFIDFQGNNIQANKIFSNESDWNHWQNLNKNNSTSNIYFENESNYSNPLSFRLTGQNAVGAIINNHLRNANDPTNDYQGTLRADGFPDNGSFEFTGQIETPTPDITPGSSPTVTPPPPSPSPSPTIGGDSGGSNPGSGSTSTPPTSTSKTKTPTKSSGSSGGGFPSTQRVTPGITPTSTVISYITPTITRDLLSLPEEGEEADLQAIIIWVIVILLLIIFGLALYLILAGKRRKRKEEQERSQQPSPPPEEPN